MAAGGGWRAESGEWREKGRGETTEMGEGKRGGEKHYRCTLLLKKQKPCSICSVKVEHSPPPIVIYTEACRSSV